MARILRMVWQLCFASCNREKQMLQPCYGDKQSQCGTAFFFVNAVSLHPMWKENISPEQKGSWWTEAVTSQEFSSLPSHGPLTGREDAWLAGLSGSSSAVQRTTCPLKSVWGSSCQLTGMSCGCLQSKCFLSQGCFSSYSVQSAFLGLETNLQKWSKTYSSCWSNI